MIILFCTGCVVAIIGFVHTRYLLTLIFIAFILVAFVYSDFVAWREPAESDLKKPEERVDALEKKQ